MVCKCAWYQCMFIALQPIVNKTVSVAPLVIAVPRVYPQITTPSIATSSSITPVIPQTTPTPIKSAPVSVVTTSSSVIAGYRSEKHIGLSPVRVRTAARLKEIQNTCALLTTFQEIDMSKLIAVCIKYFISIMTFAILV